MTILTLAFLVCLGIQQSNGAKLAVKAELDAAAMAYAPTAGLN